MTCIVGLVGTAGPERGKILLGGDCAGLAEGKEVYGLRNAKVFRKGPYAIGYTTSFRLGQIVRFATELPEPPEAPEGEEGEAALDPHHTRLEAFFATTFSDSLRRALAAHGYERPLGEGGSLLVGVRGRLFVLGLDFQVLVGQESFVAIGSGRHHAYGALAALDQLAGDSPLGLEQRARLALESAARFAPGVRGPFRFVTA